MKKYFTLLLTLFVLGSCEQEPEIIGLDANKKMSKVDVCHYDTDTDTWKTISINGNALQAHLDHGDYEGECKRYTYVPDDNFEKALAAYDDIYGDNQVPTDIIEVVTILKVEFKNISDLTGIEDFRDLEFLYCRSNNIKTLDLSENIKLKEVYCYENDLTQLVVDKNIELELILCRFNELSNLDLSKNLKLRYIDIGGNNFTTIDLSHNPLLEQLYFAYSDNISSMDVTKNVNLKVIHFSRNPLLNKIDVSKNISLERFECQFNNLTELDLSNNSNLKTVIIDWSYILTSMNMKNGANQLLISSEFRTSNSPFLSCIQVDDVVWSNANWRTTYQLYLSPNIYYSENCVF